MAKAAIACFLLGVLGLLLASLSGEPTQTILISAGLIIAAGAGAYVTSGYQYFNNLSVERKIVALIPVFLGISLVVLTIALFALFLAVIGAAKKGVGDAFR